MRRVVGTRLIAIGFLIILPNCGRIIDWGKSNFYQGENYNNHVKLVKPFIKSVTIYDELTTRANFHVLWLSDEVREQYTHLHSYRFGKDEEKYNAFLRRQLEENVHFISFYVLSIHEVKLGDTQSKWSFFLDIDGIMYHPLSFKSVELPYEYQLFFGDLWNRFKSPYLLRFAAIDAQGDPIIKPETHVLKLITRSGNKESSFVWRLKDLPEEPVVPKVTKPKKVKKVQEIVPRKRKRK